MPETYSSNECNYSAVKDYSGRQTPTDPRNNWNDTECSPHTDDDDYESPSEEENKMDLKCQKCLEAFDDKPCVKCKGLNNPAKLNLNKQKTVNEKSSKLFKCKLCSMTVYGSSQYSTHLSAHKRNQCKICGEHFAKKKHLETHTLNVHNTSLNKNLFRCHLCERMFAQRRSLVYHYKIAHPDHCHICSICLEMFDSSANLETHEATHKRETFTCHKCNEQFLKKHRYITHMDEHNKYRCEACKESFCSKKIAEKHATQGHIVEGLSQLQCAVCGQKFCSRSLLRSHIALQHSVKFFACEKCKITFKHERNYRSHLETNEHLNGEEPKHILACKECNKTFTNKNNLRAHTKRMHNSNLKEHYCTLCPYKTSIATNLKRHMNLHLEKPQFICDKCAAKFQTKSSLQEHSLIVHSDNKDFSCDKCGNQFHRRSDLNRHLLDTHSDIANYSCHCGNSYKTQRGLKRHQLLHHNIVNSKQKRLKKMFPLDVVEPPKKKAKKSKSKVDAPSSIEVNNLQLISSEIQSVIPDPNTVVMMTDNHPQGLLEEAYNIGFPSQIIEDKSHVIYTENLDLSSFQVVESMMESNNDLTKQGTSVLVNVRNVFGRPPPNNYIIDNPIESYLVNNLSGPLVDIGHKQDLMAGLQDYIIPSDMNFLNV